MIPIQYCVHDDLILIPIQNVREFDIGDDENGEMEHDDDSNVINMLNIRVTDEQWQRRAVEWTKSVMKREDALRSSKAVAVELKIQANQCVERILKINRNLCEANQCFEAGTNITIKSDDVLSLQLRISHFRVAACIVCTIYLNI